MLKIIFSKAHLGFCLWIQILTSTMIVFGFSFSFLSWNFLEIMLVHSFQLTNKSTQWYMDGSSFSFLMEFPWDPNVWCIASVGQTNHNPYIIASVGQTNPTQWYVGRAQRTNFMKICLARFSHRAFYISLEGLCFFFFSIIQNAYLEYLYEYHCFRNGNCIVLDMYLDLAEDLSSRPDQNLARVNYQTTSST